MQHRYEDEIAITDICGRAHRVDFLIFKSFNVMISMNIKSFTCFRVQMMLSVFQKPIVPEESLFLSSITIISVRGGTLRSNE